MSLLVEKYSPTNINQLLGSSNTIYSLNRWFDNWKSPNGKNDFLRIVLIHGPPGAGKTTLVKLLVESKQYKLVATNASDTRKANQIHDIIQTSTRNKESGVLKKLRQTQTRVALVFDEVDGFAGNEDRGGIKEIISVAKTTQVPIICICNDVYATCLKSLKSYCLVIPMNYPEPQEIIQRLQLIGNIEIRLLFDQLFPQSGVNGEFKISSSTLSGWMLENKDVRSCLNRLQEYLYGVINPMISSERKLETSVLKLRKFLSTKSEEKVDTYKDQNTSMYNYFHELDRVDATCSSLEDVHQSIHDTDLSLFWVQQNVYRRITPQKLKWSYKRKSSENNEIIDNWNPKRLMSRVADSFSDADIMYKSMISDQAFLSENLNHAQSFVPCALTVAYQPKQVRSNFLPKPSAQSLPVEFPSMLGQISKMNGRQNILKSLSNSLKPKVRNVISSRSAMRDFLDYYVPDMLINSINDNPAKTAERMYEIGWNREQWDELSSVSMIQVPKESPIQIDSKLKASFTRSLNGLYDGKEIKKKKDEPTSPNDLTPSRQVAVKKQTISRKNAVTTKKERG